MQCSSAAMSKVIMLDSFAASAEREIASAAR
jgi:hypothetical protein